MVSPEKRRLLDIFSPMFTLFSGGSTADIRDEAGDAAAPDAKAEAVTSVRAAVEQLPQKLYPEPVAAPAPPPAAAVPQPAAPQEQHQQDEDEELDEFDPYIFIRSLPSHPPPLHRPVCLPKKTRGTFPVSLILDLDETLLHSSIVPLPTYDVVFPVHFNAVNYQVYVRKRPHMDYFLERVSQMFEIIIFTASQKVRLRRLGLSRLSHEPPAGILEERCAMARQVSMPTCRASHYGCSVYAGLCGSPVIHHRSAAQMDQAPCLQGFVRRRRRQLSEGSHGARMRSMWQASGAQQLAHPNTGRSPAVDRAHCLVKQILGRDLGRSAIVDNSPQAFGFQLDNGIPILSWFEDTTDTELLKLLPFLESLANVDDVRPLIREQFKLYKRVHGS